MQHLGQRERVLPAATEVPEEPTSAAKQYREARSSLLTSDAESVRVLDSALSQCSTQASARTSNESASTRYATADEAEPAVDEPSQSRSAMERTLLADAQQSPGGVNDAGKRVMSSSDVGRLHQAGNDGTPNQSGKQPARP